jgi:hypothetical protein
MNLREDIRALKTGDRDLRRFGVTVGGVFALIGLLLLHRHRTAWPFFVVPGAALMGLGLLWPRALKPVYLAWMAAALLLGSVVAHMLLTLLFLFVVTPMGLLARLTGRDFLRLKPDRAAASYWLPRKAGRKTSTDYERQF